MSFLKKLFGGGGTHAPKAAPAAEPVDYKGYSIVAAPMSESGQFRVAGSITKTINGEEKLHKFIRADVFTDRDEAIAATIRKAHVIIDQSGDRIFS
jgi:hypothetical protein